MASKAVIPLSKYQWRWVKDKSRFKIGCFTRQGGKSFSSTLEVVLDCQKRKTMWVLLSAGERQSKELMAKAALHAKAQNMVIQEVESDYRAKDGTTYKMLEIVFPNGSRIVGLPANPDTARGWSANILLDEFALHKDAREIWRAMFPTVTRGYRVIVVSTFKGKSNKFYELFYGAPTLQRYDGQQHEYVGERGGWSKHLVDIHDAVAMGLELRDEEGQPCEPEDLRLALNDEDAWDEEYLCNASDEASAFLTHELISSVEGVTLNPSPDWVGKLLTEAQAQHREFKATGGESRPAPPVHLVPELGQELYAGMDIGRKRDLSVLWVDSLVSGILTSVAIIEMVRQPFFVQEQILFAILKLPMTMRACVDESGMGMQLAENASDLFGGRVEGVPFTSANKEILAMGLLRNFQDRCSLIPADSTIRASLHSVKKYETQTKHFRFDAQRSDATGHADHFWAKALAVQAASTGGNNDWVCASAGNNAARRITHGYGGRIRW